jgi:hypothetical protein
MAWGQVAVHLGLPATLIIAAAGLVVALLALRRWRLQTGASVDLNPSMHWPAPVPAQDIDGDRGPVLVTVEYRIASDDRAPFLAALARLSDQRLRDGAFEWNVFEDAAEPGRFVETFLIASWLEHLRQHQRVTHEARELQERVHGFHKGQSPPAVAHLIAAELGAE